MARLPRLFVNGVPNHLIVRGNNRQDVFRSEGDRIYFHRCLSELASQGQVEIHAYVMMSNHVHMLASVHDACSIPVMVQRLGRRYVGYFNYMYRRTGTLWEGRYKSSLVDTDHHFLTCQRYIELNPVRAGMVRHPSQFAWSSYRRNAAGRPDTLVTSHYLYEALGSRPIDAGTRIATSSSRRSTNRLFARSATPFNTGGPWDPRPSASVSRPWDAGGPHPYPWGVLENSN